MEAIEKAVLLIEQKRYELAEKELLDALGAAPEDAYAHTLLAICYAQQKKAEDAHEAAQRAVHVAPDYAFAHYMLASVLDDLERLDEAEQALNDAIRLDPEDAAYFALLSSLHMQRRRWEAALEAAERGLEIDSEHVGCLNLRAMALNNLNRKDEASAAISGALNIAPQDATSHASQGWHEVERGDQGKAMTHFREALRLDSNLAWARAGVVEALKARNPIYRVLLRYFLWTSRLRGKVLWAFIIGAFILSRVVRETIKTNPEWAPLLWPVLGIYIAFVLMTWIAQPLFNLLLRLHPLGRVALSQEQITSTNWLGGAILVSVASLCLWLLSGFIPLLVLSIGAGMMVIPISNSLGQDSMKAKKTLLIYTAVLGAIGLVTVGLSGYSLDIMLVPAIIFVLGISAYGWVANALTIRS